MFVYPKLLLTVGFFSSLMLASAQTSTSKPSPNTHQKGKGYFETKIERVDDQSSTELVRLLGTVSSKKDFGSIIVMWLLPENVELINGSLETNTKINKGEEQNYEVLVKLNSPGNHQIHFLVQETVDGDDTKLGSSSQYNTELTTISESSDLQSRGTNKNKATKNRKLKKPKKILQ